MTALVKDFKRYPLTQPKVLYSDFKSNELLAKSFKRYELLPLMPYRAWLIEEGFVRKVNYSETGSVITHGIWSERDIVGLPNPGHHRYELECLTPVRCRSVRLQDINISEIRLQQLKQMEMFLNILHCSRIAQRIWMLLEWLGRRYAQVSQRGCVLDLPLTQEAIAELIGTSRVTVTRSLKEFEAAGKLVKLSSRKILLNSIEPSGV